MTDANPPPTPPTPHVGLFWVVRTAAGALRLLGASCPLTEAEPYGDFLTYGPGHYETWTRWRRDRSLDPAVRAIVHACEYEAWPRGRSVFHRPQALFILYAESSTPTASCGDPRFSRQFKTLKNCRRTGRSSKATGIIKAPNA
jgi:hypothetical protein